LSRSLSINVIAGRNSVSEPQAFSADAKSHFALFGPQTVVAGWG